MTATIAYDRPMKNLIDELSKTGHVTHKAYKKKSVTLHHNGGRLTHEGCLAVWKVRPASAHFDIDKNGAACQYVKVNEYAWAVGNTVGNQETISIEMCNETLSPGWQVSKVTWNSACRLAGWLFYKVIGARPSKSNFFYHHHWKSTLCAGPYMDKIYNQALAAAQAAYDYFKGAKTPPKPALPDHRGPRKSLTQIAAEVWAGKWGSGSDRAKRLKAAGYDPDAVQKLVNKGVGKHKAPTPAPARKSITTIAREVIAGKWGNGDTRKRRLAGAGYNAAEVQKEVNRLL